MNQHCKVKTTSIIIIINVSVFIIIVFVRVVVVCIFIISSINIIIIIIIIAIIIIIIIIIIVIMYIYLPVDKGALGVHEVKLVVQTGPGLGDGGGVAQHAHSTLHLGQVTARYHSWRLVVNAHLQGK
jgi:hypothetical protein